MGKTVALVIASLGLVAFGCSSSLGPPDDDLMPAKALSTTASTEDACGKLAAKSGACGWSQSATVGCVAALRNAASDLTRALEACLAEEDCNQSRACVDAALVGSATPDLDASADGGIIIIDPTDASTVTDNDAGIPTTTTPDASTAPASCTHSVDFADTTCKACMDTSCCGESAICGKSQACLDLLTCVAECDDGDLTCEASCKSIRASATISAFDDLRSCRNTSCDSACPTF